jgi:Ca2+:H+ antiporter
MDTVNHARIKRQAHNLSRRDTENWWSPVRHIHHSKQQRSSTWEPDLEMNQENVDLENGSPIEHASTEPTYMSRPYQRQDDDGTDGMNAPYDNDDIQKNDTQPPRESQRSTESSGDATYVDSQTHQSSSEVNGKGEDGLRARSGKHRQDAGKESAADGSRGDEKAGHGQGLLSKLRHKDTEASDESKDEKSKKQHSWFQSVKPKEKFTVGNQIRRTLFGSWINILLLAAPAGIAINYAGHVNGIIIFVVNFLAIIPLAAMLSFGTEEIALRTGETLGGLLNATFG